MANFVCIGFQIKFQIIYDPIRLYGKSGAVRVSIFETKLDIK